jgi:hypothetical protein
MLFSSAAVAVTVVPPSWKSALPPTEEPTLMPLGKFVTPMEISSL